MKNRSKFEKWAVKYKVSVGNSEYNEHIVYNVPGKCREVAGKRVVDHFNKFMRTCLPADNYKISIISTDEEMRTLTIKKLAEGKPLTKQQKKNTEKYA